MTARWTYDGKGTSCWRIMDPGVQWAVGLNTDGTWGVTKHDARSGVWCRQCVSGGMAQIVRSLGTCRLEAA